jgi:hypothetical protein
VWHDLPPRMKARRLASGKVLYYYQAGGKQIALGSNLITAREEWARLEGGAAGQSLAPHHEALPGRRVPLPRHWHPSALHDRPG